MYVITTNMGSSQVWSPSQDSQQAKRAGGPALDEEDDRRFDVCFVCLSGCAHACARCSGRGAPRPPRDRASGKGQQRPLLQDMSLQGCIGLQ